MLVRRAIDLATSILSTLWGGVAFFVVRHGYGATWGYVAAVIAMWLVMWQAEKANRRI
jgi:hypothetical protein